MFPSDLFPQLVNFAEQLFLVPGQGFGYVYFAFGSDTKIGEVNSFLVNKLPSVRIEAIPHIPSRELDYYLWWCIFFKSWQWVRGREVTNISNIKYQGSLCRRCILKLVTNIWEAH